MLDQGLTAVLNDIDDQGICAQAARSPPSRGNDSTQDPRIDPIGAGTPTQNRPAFNSLAALRYHRGVADPKLPSITSPTARSTVFGYG